MKKLFLAVLIMLVWSSLAMAATIKWDAPTGVPDGYIVYYTDGADSWNKSTTETSMDIAGLNLTPGTYTFHVTAFNTMGESGPSNMADYIMDGFMPPGDNLKGVTFVIPGPVTFIIE